MKRTIQLASLAAAAFALSGCINVRTHSSFDPLYVNLDINLRVQLQEELANAFGDIDAASATLNENE